MDSTKVGKIIGYMFLILISIILLIMIYETFFTENPHAISVISTVSFLVLVGGISILICLDKISSIFPKNKRLKKIVKKIEKIWTQITDGFFGF